jgi:signal transduction histidine kinase
MKRLMLATVTIVVLLVIFIAAGCANNPGSQANIESEKQTAQAVVHSAASGLGAVLAGYQNETDRINLIRTYIDPVRFYPDQSGYFYVYDSNCVNIAHATQKDLQGQSLYDYKDTRGNYVIRLLAAAAKKGGGFVEYYWIKPNSATKEEQQKIGYVEPIPGTDYFIGTGVYTGN